MKKVIYLTLFVGISLFQQAQAQSPVGFPDGITVGTGVTIPSGSPYKMAISGGIITEKVRVATNGTTFWADFVFDKKYKLRPLSEVEKFIKTNQHLPEIPSTSDVTKNGIDLAETQALLLQKVEELTLYVIHQNKKIERLEKKVKVLNRKR
jgi:hypothetical protein